jgi:hypothetical protein
MALNLSAASNILKVRYIGTIREQLNNATVLLSKIGRRDQMVSGKTFSVPLHTGRNTSAGYGLSDGGTLPTAGQQAYSTSIVPNKYLYGTIQVTGPTIAATRDNVGAFVEALNSEVEGLMRDTKRDMNRQLNGDGTGALAYWTTADDSSGGIVDDGIGNPFVHLPTSAISCDLIDATDGTTNLSSAHITVTLGAATSTGYNVTWTGLTTGSADGDFLVKASTMASDGSLEMMGIDAIISDDDPSAGAGGSLQGLAVASNAFWKAQDFGSYTSPAAIAFEDIQEVIDAIATQSDYGESDIAFMLSNYGVRRAYYKLCVAERRHVNTMELDGGFKALDFNGIPWVVDAQTNRETLYFVVPDTMQIFRTSDFDWMDKDGSYLSRVSGADAYQAVLFHYGNLACLSRNGNGVLRGIIEA